MRCRLRNFCSQFVANRKLPHATLLMIGRRDEWGLTEQTFDYILTYFWSYYRKIISLPKES